jgi:hypothetical protein
MSWFKSDFICEFFFLSQNVRESVQYVTVIFKGTGTRDYNWLKLVLYDGS